MIVGLVAVVSCGHAVWMAAASTAAPSPDVAHTYALALEAMRAFGTRDPGWFTENLGVVVPNPQLVPIWMGFWMWLFGGAREVGIAALLPFHLLAAVGLWRGGAALGGRPGAVWALFAGLGAAGTLTYASELLLDFPMMACTAYAAGSALSGRHRAAALGLAGAALCKLAALPMLAVMAIDVLVTGRRQVWMGALLVAALYLPNVGELLAYGGASQAAAVSTVGQRVAYHLQSVGAVAGPAVLVGVVLGLLARGDVVTLRVLGWAAGALLGLVPLAFFAQVRYAVPLVPLLALAGAGAGRWASAGLGVAVLVQLGGFHTAREGWPGRPAALRPVVEEHPFAVDAVFDWLMAHSPDQGGRRMGPRLRVALHLSGSDRLHYGLFAVRALERGLPLELVVVDDHRPLDQVTDLGVVIAPRGKATVRQGWRLGLPPATETLSWPDDYLVELWDRGLPPETLLATPAEAERRNHPSKQGLWVYVDGQERGPLIERASSAEVIRTDAGWEALFVRDQAVWRASSVDGFTFGEAAPLRDLDGAAIEAFDPAVVVVPEGVRLFAAELVGEDRHVDPASHPTRIVSWTGPSLDTLRRDPGVRIEGVGLVDPSVGEEETGVRMYLTEGRSRIAAASSADGLTFTREPDVLDGYTVPEVRSPGVLLAQRQVMGWSVLVGVLAPGSLAAAVGPKPRLLELCGTGPALVAGRLYYTRAPDDCPVPVALPDRRGHLDALLHADVGVGGIAP